MCTLEKWACMHALGDILYISSAYVNKHGRRQLYFFRQFNMLAVSFIARFFLTPIGKALGELFRFGPKVVC